MKRSYSPLLVCMVLISSLAFTSCVSKGKYLSLQSRANKLQSDSVRTHNALDGCNVRAQDLENAKSALEAENSNAQKDLRNLSKSSNMTIADQARRLKNLQDLLQTQRDVMNKLKKTVGDALVNFKPDELSVYIKDGNLYVSLQEKLLFKSGSADVDPKGKQALGYLAAVLNSNPDINVMIEGHTDTVPIKNSRFEDNWALSVTRSAAIVRILTKDNSVDAHRVTAAGRGEYHPVQSNATDWGKTSNRRTEIILSPNLNELYTLLNYEPEAQR